jgi:AcrR family transcriptional regulator
MMKATGRQIRKTAATSIHAGNGLLARRQPSQLRSRKSVALCLKAAQMLIERDGIDRVTTKKIAQTAGLSVGAVYGYFQNKEAIIYQLGATWMQGIRVMIADLHPSRSQIDDPFAYVNRFVDSAAEQYRNQPALAAVINMLSAIPELRELDRKHDTEVVESLISAFAHYVPNANVKDLEALGRSVVLLVHTVLSAALVYKTCEPERALRNLLVALHSLIVQTLIVRPCVTT